MGVNCDFCKIDIKTTSHDHSACSRDFLLNLSAGELIPSIREMRNIRYDLFFSSLKKPKLYLKIHLARFHCFFIDMKASIRTMDYLRMRRKPRALSEHSLIGFATTTEWGDVGQIKP